MMMTMSGALTLLACLLGAAPLAAFTRISSVRTRSTFLPPEAVPKLSTAFLHNTRPQLMLLSSHDDDEKETVPLVAAGTNEKQTTTRIAKKSRIKNPWKHNDADILHRAYHRKHVSSADDPTTTPYDYIIIGSGIGGLWLAACLAKFNYTSLVLEQHYIAGGLQHTFNIGDYEFVPGLHYIANLDLVGPLYEMVATPTDPPLRFTRAGNCTSADKGQCSSHDLQVGELPEIHMLEGVDNVRQELLTHFPNETRAINEFLSLVEKAKWEAGLFATLRILPPWLQWILSQLLCSSYLYAASRSTEEIVQDLTQDGRFKTVLSLFAGDLGESLGGGSFVMQAAVLGHVLEGCYYPESGPVQLVRGLVPTIRQGGGDVLVKARVQEILVEHGRARGVKLVGRRNDADGDCLYAKRGVVSDAGLDSTLRHLLPQHFVHGDRAPLRKLYEEAVATGSGAISHCFGFVGLNASAEELNLRSSSYYYLPWNLTDASMDATAIQDYYRDTLLDPNVEDVSAGWVFVTAKDPYYSNITMPGKSTVIIFSEAWTEDFAVFLDESGSRGMHSKRTEEYEAAKALVEHKMMRGLLQCFPHLEPHVEVVEIGTPLTMLDYTRRNITLGLRHNPRRMTSQVIRPDCAIPGLYFTGQDVAFAGWAGAMTGAMVTAQKLLGYTLMDFARGKTLMSDLGKGDLEDRVREKMKEASKTTGPWEVAAEIVKNAVRRIQKGEPA